MEDYQVIQANLFAQLDASCYVITDPRFYTDGIEDYDYRLLVENVFNVNQFVADVLKSNQPGFQLKKITRVRNDLVFHKNEFQTLSIATLYFRHVIGMYFSLSIGYTFGPFVKLFRRCIEQLGLQCEFLNVPCAISLRTGKQEYELFNELINLIRHKSQSREFKKQIRHRQDNLKLGYISTHDFIDFLFVKYKRLLVVRVDLGYQKVCSKNMSIERAKDDMAHLLKNLRADTGLSKGMVAYVWRWEFGWLKGPHAHCLFFFDGGSVQRDEYWGKRLGEYWVEVISPGRGHYWNVNIVAKKVEYDRKGLLGIGMIHRDDTSMRDNLINYVLAYLFKDEQHILAKAANKSWGKLFGKGIL